MEANRGIKPPTWLNRRLGRSVFLLFGFFGQGRFDIYDGRILVSTAIQTDSVVHFRGAALRAERIIAVFKGMMRPTVAGLGPGMAHVVYHDWPRIA